ILILTFYIIFQMSQGIGTSATMKLAFKTSLIYAILLVICGGIVIGWLSHSMTKTKKEFTY
ncbi:MAG: hypothetical protein KAR35_03400, partial [Candidatus Heimdallarchaeota archaeon]|nr:hypothetical protein [Candidatus Heimdallarchaeota archaeon]